MTGVVGGPPVTKELLEVSNTFSTSGDQTLIAAPTTQSRIVITHIVIQNTTTTSATFLLKRGSTQFFAMLCEVQGKGIAWRLDAGREYRLPPKTALVLNLSAAVAFNVTIWYFLE
jgi:hypothetical protein